MVDWRDRNHGIRKQLLTFLALFLLSHLLEFFLENMISLRRYPQPASTTLNRGYVKFIHSTQAQSELKTEALEGTRE